MKVDQYGCLVREQVGYPGSIGDSCMETGYYLNLLPTVPKDLRAKEVASMEPFATIDGFVRHPDAPGTWRESDFSSDNALGLLVGSHLLFPKLFKSFNDYTIANWFCTGNGKLISPLVYTVMRQNWLLMGIFLWVQSFLLKLPFRWSDRKKWFESSKDSSTDWVQWFHVALIYVRISKKKSPGKWLAKEQVMTKIYNYYAPEPNNAWILSAYEHAAKKIWPNS